MEPLLFVVMVGGTLLLIGTGIYLITRLIMRRAEPGRTPRYPSILVVIAVLNLLMAVIYALDGRLVWQGAAHVAIAVGLLVGLWLNRRTVRT